MWGIRGLCWDGRCGFMSSVLWAKNGGVGASAGERGGSESVRAGLREGNADTTKRAGSVGVGDGESLVERDRRERFRVCERVAVFVEVDVEGLLFFFVVIGGEGERESRRKGGGR